MWVRNWVMNLSTETLVDHLDGNRRGDFEPIHCFRLRLISSQILTLTHKVASHCAASHKLFYITSLHVFINCTELHKNAQNSGTNSHPHSHQQAVDLHNASNAAFRCAHGWCTRLPGILKEISCNRQTWLPFYTTACVALASALNG